MRIQQWLQQAAQQLVTHERLQEVSWLLQEVLQVNSAYLLAHAEQVLTPMQLIHANNLLERRRRGEPIAYILQRQDFWHLRLRVTADTLIPRADTELLVEKMLALLSPIERIKLLELGTGSGAIALAIASERPKWQIEAIDQSAAALRVAQKNAQHLQITNVKFYLSDWFAQVPEQKYHAIVANPPYIAQNDPHLQQGDLRFEPPAALVSGAQGLDAIKTIIENAPRYLHAQGFILLEHGFTQAPAVQQLLQQGFSNIVTHRDLAGHERVTHAQYLGS